MFIIHRLSALLVLAITAFGARAEAHEGCGYEHDQPSAAAAAADLAEDRATDLAEDRAADRFDADAVADAEIESTVDGWAPAFYWDYRQVVHYGCGFHAIYYVRIGGVTRLRCGGCGYFFNAHIPF